jgi:L,D-transpeptidase ErfK/SrfK
MLLLAAFDATAETFVLPPAGVDLVGEVRVVYARYEDTLMDIARQYDLGYDEILQANPGVDRWIPGEGTPVILPTRYILPDVPHEGIVLNLPEKRLYYFPPPRQGEKPLVMTYPIGIGRMDWETPIGVTRIVGKTKNPTWTPPASIKAEHLERDGEVLPNVVPAGPDNPLGAYAMRLAIPGYLIHGTNKRDGVGSRVSHGCIRLYPENIEELFNMVSIGTALRIINQPVKAGWFAGSLFLEAHAPFEDEQAPNHATLDEAIRILMDKLGIYGSLAVDPASIELVVDQASGLPAPVIN